MFKVLVFLVAAFSLAACGGGGGGSDDKGGSGGSTPSKPQVELSALTVFEGDEGETTDIDVVAKVREAFTEDTTINFETLGDSADFTDFKTAGDSATFVFPKNSLSAKIRLQINGDYDVEADEKFVVKLKAGTGYSLGNRVTTTVTIKNDDRDIGFSVVDDDATELDSGSRDHLVQVTFTARTPRAFVMNYQIGFGTTGTATAGEDFIARSGNLAVPENVTNITFPITRLLLRYLRQITN